MGKVRGYFCFFFGVEEEVLVFLRLRRGRGEGFLAIGVFVSRVGWYFIFGRR